MTDAGSFPTPGIKHTAAVTDSGYEIFGERARGWNRGGQAAAQG